MWRLRSGEPPDQHPAQPGERADGAQVRQHPVDAVEILVHVFEDEQCAVEVGEVPGADEALQQAEVAAGERALRTTAMDDGDTVGSAARARRAGVGSGSSAPGGLGAGQHLGEVAAGERRHLGARGRRVKGDHAGAADDAREQRGDVGVSDHRARAP